MSVIRYLYVTDNDTDKFTEFWRWHPAQMASSVAQEF